MHVQYRDREITVSKAPNILYIYKVLFYKLKLAGEGRIKPDKSINMGQAQSLLKTIIMYEPQTTL